MNFISRDFFKTTRFKTILWYSGLFLLLELFTGFLVYLHLRDNLYKELDDSLSKTVRWIFNIVSANEDQLKNFNPNSVFMTKEELIFNLISEEIIFNRRNFFIQIKHGDSIIFSSDNLMNEQIIINDRIKNGILLVNYYNSLISKHELRVAHLAKDNFEITVTHPTFLITKIIGDLLYINLILIPTFLFLAIIGGAIISKKSLSRIDNIIIKTKKITEYNLNETIPGGEFNDEYGRLARTMNDMILRTKRAIDYMSQFSIAVSHQLKTPLTIMRGEIEVALQSHRPANELKQILQSNYEEALRLTNIVNKLFLLSKVDNSLLKLNKENININELIPPVISQMQIFAINKNMKIVFDLINDINLFVDVDLMRGAIANLIENAIKYGEENSIIKISTSLSKSNLACISINNKGRIIPMDLREKVFERFFRSEDSCRLDPGGIGLGLSITKSIVEFHNGKIWIESESNNATTFRISLELKDT